jgi:hypothetical protein
VLSLAPEHGPIDTAKYHFAGALPAVIGTNGFRRGQMLELPALIPKLSRKKVTDFGCQIPVI